MRNFAYRVFLAIINIIFPPVAVMMLCGPSWDCMLNCAFFILAVIPSHIHGFYITCTYFHRRRKVRKGRYPGGPKSMIHSKYVLNGGASDREVERLMWKEKGGAPQSERETMSRQDTNTRRLDTHSSRRSNQGRTRRG